eukprot:gene10766-9739_t
MPAEAPEGDAGPSPSAPAAPLCIWVVPEGLDADALLSGAVRLFGADAFAGMSPGQLQVLLSSGKVASNRDRVAELFSPKRAASGVTQPMQA